MSRKQITEILTKAAIGYWVKKGFGISKEIGVTPSGTRRADLLAVDYKGTLVICEVKSGLLDYISDKKYVEYLPCCNKMYFVVHDLEWIKPYKAEWKALNIGVLWLDPSTGYIKCVQRCSSREMVMDVQRKIVLHVACRGEFSGRNTYRTKCYIEEC